MPRRPRLLLPGVPVHLIQRGVDRTACFFTDEDRAFYLDALAELAAALGCAVHGYVLACQRYIELNPVRAGMVARPAAYAWSSHRANAGGLSSRLVTPHALYLALGAEPESRRAAYRALFETALPGATVDAIRAATNGNFALGGERFRDQVETMLGRRARPGTPGRPRKKK